MPFTAPDETNIIVFKTHVTIYDKNHTIFWLPFG